jgi:hypothetical protein
MKVENVEGPYFSSCHGEAVLNGSEETRRRSLSCNLVKLVLGPIFLQAQGVGQY